MPTGNRSVGKRLKGTLVSAPVSLDWRQNGVVTSVKNQGSCGSCWAFAACASGESHLIVKGEYENGDINLSEQYLLECTYSSTCNGGYMEYAMETVYTTPTESEYAYNPYSSYNGICSANGINVANSNEDHYDLSDD